MHRRTFRSIAVTALMATGVLLTVGAAGVSEPLRIRSVNLSGQNGPAYYSVIEQGYRFVGGTARTSTLASVSPGDSGAEMKVSSLSAADGENMPGSVAAASADPSAR